MTIREIARLAGVSVSTVSKIMNGKDDSISSSTRTRVLNLAKEYHYSPYASVLSGNSRTMLLGVIFRSLKNRDTILSGILDAAQNADYSLTVSASGNDPELEYRQVSSMISRHADGILLEASDHFSKESKQALADAGIPCVFFHCSQPQAVCLDFRRLGYQATELLIRHRHREIGCLLDTGRYADSVLQGYRQCLFDHNIPFRSELLFRGPDQNLLRSIASHSVSGLVASHYLTALRLYEKLNTLHYTLPCDLSLVTLKDDAYAAFSCPDITSLPVPRHEFGNYLGRLLIARLESLDEPAFAFDPQPAGSMATVGVPYDRQGKKILVVGSINIDNYLRVDTLPHSGKAVNSPIAQQYPGGKGMNQAVGVSKMGRRVSLIGSVGNDLDSDLIFSVIRRFNIDPRGVHRNNDAKTGQAYIFVQKDGDSMISILSGANITLTPETVQKNEGLFDNTGFCLIPTEIPLETVEAACVLARKHQVQTILKPSAVGPLPCSILRLTDYLIPNEDELKEICPQGSSLEERAEYLLQQGVGNVIVTLGPRGCYLKNKDTSSCFPAAKFSSVDSSGACDAFISALACYLLDGYSLEASIRIATYAAGFSVTREGVVPALIDKNTLESYIRQQEDLLR